mmetsp:Transcript_118389/g.281024  ORF Transcript_118389/g.281024 Transcript_118389/m.281024 type:complete len:222 (-) Transcript_118389:1478-2143(-)
MQPEELGSFPHDHREIAEIVNTEMERLGLAGSRTWLLPVAVQRAFAPPWKREPACRGIGPKDRWIGTQGPNGSPLRQPSQGSPSELSTAPPPRGTRLGWKRVACQILRPRFPVWTPRRPVALGSSPAEPPGPCERLRPQSTRGLERRQPPSHVGSGCAQVSQQLANPKTYAVHFPVCWCGRARTWLRPGCSWCVSPLAPGSARGLEAASPPTSSSAAEARP